MYLWYVGKTCVVTYEWENEFATSQFLPLCSDKKSPLTVVVSGFQATLQRVHMKRSKSIFKDWKSEFSTNWALLNTSYSWEHWQQSSLHSVFNLSKMLLNWQCEGQLMPSWQTSPKQTGTMPQTDPQLSCDSWDILGTYPCEHFEGIYAIIHCSLDIIHQIVCRSTNKYSRNSTILLFC